MGKYKSTIKPSNCPQCGSKKMSKILWGYPDFEYKKLLFELEEGRITMGGSVVDEDNDPTWKCVACKTEISLGSWKV
jgi:hypothetical protein